MNKLNYDGDKSIIKIIIQFIKFGMVGALNTIISLVTYYILIHFNVNYIIANTIGFILGTLNAYYWNNRYVFKKEEDEKRSTVKSGIKVFISYGFTFLLGTFLLILWVDILNIPENIAPVINLIITIPLNFVLNKLWAFKNERKK